MHEVPKSLQRVADEIDGWLELRAPERALPLLPALLDEPAGRTAGLVYRVRAYVRQGKYDLALADLAELRNTVFDQDWIDLTEAFVQRRRKDVKASLRVVERLLERNPKSAHGHFNLGCYLVLTGEHERGLDEITLACGLDAEYRTFARDEPDLDPLRDDPRFEALVGAADAAKTDGEADEEEEDEGDIEEDVDDADEEDDDEDEDEDEDDEEEEDEEDEGEEDEPRS